MALTRNWPLTLNYLGTSAASVATGQNGYVVAPFKGKIVEAGVVIGSATTTADATVTTSIAGTAVTGGAFVITQSGSAAGNKDYAATGDASANAVITAANIANEGDVIKFAITGSGTGGGPVHCYVKFLKLA